MTITKILVPITQIGSNFIVFYSDGTTQQIEPGKFDYTLQNMVRDNPDTLLQLTTETIENNLFRRIDTLGNGGNDGSGGFALSFTKNDGNNTFEGGQVLQAVLPDSNVVAVGYDAIIYKRGSSGNHSATFILAKIDPVFANNYNLTSLGVTIQDFQSEENPDNPAQWIVTVYYDNPTDSGIQNIIIVNNVP